MSVDKQARVVEEIEISKRPVTETERVEGTVEEIPDGATQWDDVVHGDTRFENASIEDFIILRTDGTPIYNLAVVSDDIDMRITHVIRGDDHIPNTPKQILLYQALGAPVPVFAHLPMILGGDGRKLSKRHGATAVGDYAQLGVLPEALFNFLALLGWNPGDEREVMGAHHLHAQEPREEEEVRREAEAALARDPLFGASLSASILDHSGLGSEYGRSCRSGADRKRAVR